MLTKNRRGYLKKRNKEKSAEYDYRILKWLEAMLDPGENGGIGDINCVLDTLDRDSIRKHLKDENIDALLTLVEKLLDILEFVPLEIEEKEIDYQGKKIKQISYRAVKTILAAQKDSGDLNEMCAIKHDRAATIEDRNRYDMMKEHQKLLQLFIDPGNFCIPEIRSAEYFKDQIRMAHEEGLVAVAFDKK